MTGPKPRLRAVVVIAAVAVGALGLVGNAADLISLFTTIGLLGTGALVAAAVGVATCVEGYRHRHFRRPGEPRRTAGGLRAERAVGVASVVVALLLGTLAVVRAPAVQGGDREPVRPLPPAGASTGDRAATPVLGFEFLQDDVHRPVRLRREQDYDVVQVQITPEPFTIRFPRRDGDAPIELVAWVDRSLFTLRPGQPTSELPYFTVGSGMADGMAPGELSLIISTDGHNHLSGPRIVDDGPAHERTAYNAIVLKGGDDFYLPGASVVAYLDRNRDDVIDSGEYEYLELQVTR